ncbi:hypothetical protein [Glutamicibacter sp. NPDC087344]|uniref:hypothetical protein n=1 Tax=Glutamicibacter sp. NPDC087344 TaxID=3363994 RepID=UPI003802D1B2
MKTEDQVSTFNLARGLVLRGAITGLLCSILAGLILALYSNAMFSPEPGTDDYRDDVQVLIAMFAPISGLLLGVAMGIVCFLLYVALRRSPFAAPAKKRILFGCVVLSALPAWVLLQPFWGNEAFRIWYLILPAAVAGAWVSARYIGRLRPDWD